MNSIPRLVPLRLEPRLPVIVNADRLEQDSRSNADDLIDRLVERFGLETVHRLLWYAALRRGLVLPCDEGGR